MEGNSPEKLFEYFGLPVKFGIDKDLLKKRYFFSAKKTLSGDSMDQSEEKSQLINSAYSILNDDFARAKLFTVPDKTVSRKFLEQCIDLEDRIKKGEDISLYLDKKIGQCKEKHADSKSLSKWGYYKRLRDMIMK